MFPSKVISNLAKTFSSQLSLNPSLVLAISCNRGFQTSSVDNSSKHGGMYTKDYNILKERPLGPHKKLPPGVKHDGRVGELANYRYKVHYPEVSFFFVFERSIDSIRTFYPGWQIHHSKATFDQTWRQGSRYWPQNNWPCGRWQQAEIQVDSMAKTTR